jgi:excisionase family DNA binding protein
MATLAEQTAELVGGHPTLEPGGGRTPAEPSAVLLAGTGPVVLTGGLTGVVGPRGGAELGEAQHLTHHRVQGCLSSVDSRLRKCVAKANRDIDVAISVVNALTGLRRRLAGRGQEGGVVGRTEGQTLPHLLDIEAVAEHLGVGVRHVRRLVAERRIPYLKWGHLLRFDPQAIAHWLDEGRRAPRAG